MMMRIIVALLFLLSAGRMCSFAQLLDREEDRLTLQEPPVAAEVDAATGVPLVSAGTAASVRTDKEIKYVAGKDGLWFTADDEICHYYVIERDAGGRITKKTWFQPDHSVYDYQEFVYDAAGRVESENSFDGQGKKLYDARYSYDTRGRKTRVVRYDPSGKEIWSMGFEYDRNGLIVKDFEYSGKELEKYHVFEYDRKKRLIRAMECNAGYNGRGPDQRWFTADDVVSSTKASFYDRKGVKIRDQKYIAPGPDNRWFTADDIMQYYALFEYGKTS